MLFDAVIRFGMNNGFEKLHLGGGRSTSKADSLFRFKENFSRTTGSFYIGGKIYDQQIYSIVCEHWSAKHPHLIDKYSDKLFRYRYFC